MAPATSSLRCALCIVLASTRLTMPQQYFDETWKDAQFGGVEVRSKLVFCKLSSPLFHPIGMVGSVPFQVRNILSFSLISIKFHFQPNAQKYQNPRLLVSLKQRPWRTIIIGLL